MADELEKKHHVSPLMGMDQQAALLKLKGARYHPHPEGAEVAR